MKKSSLIIVFTLACSLGFAQNTPFRVKLFHEDEPVYINLEQTSANIEGYDGDEIIIEAVPAPANVKPVAAAGLQQLSIPGRAMEDLNIQPQMQDHNSAMSINVPAGNYRHLLIKVPRTSLIFVQIFSNYIGSSIKANDMNSIQITGTVQLVDVSNVSNFVVEVGENWKAMRANGRVNISNIRWTDAPVIVNGKAAHRTCIVKTNNSDVVLSVADDAKANIIFSSMFSQTYSNLNAVAVPSGNADASVFRQYNDNEAPLRPQTLKLGGGGVNAVIGSTYGNIFIKKQ